MLTCNLYQHKEINWVAAFPGNYLETMGQLLKTTQLHTDSKGKNQSDIAVGIQNNQMLRTNTEV